MRRQFSPQRLYAARKAAGMSREFAALAVERSHASLVSYELGRVTPPTGVLTALADLYGADVADLFEPVEVAV